MNLFWCVCTIYTWQVRPWKGFFFHRLWQDSNKLLPEQATHQLFDSLHHRKVWFQHWIFPKSLVILGIHYWMLPCFQSRLQFSRVFLVRSFVISCSEGWLTEAKSLKRSWRLSHWDCMSMKIAVTPGHIITMTITRNALASCARSKLFCFMLGSFTWADAKKADTTCKPIRQVLQNKMAALSSQKRLPHNEALKILVHCLIDGQNLSEWLMRNRVGDLIKSYIFKICKIALK